MQIYLVFCLIIQRRRRGELQKKLQMLAKFEMAERVRVWFPSHAL